MLTKDAINRKSPKNTFRRIIQERSITPAQLWAKIRSIVPDVRTGNSGK